MITLEQLAHRCDKVRWNGEDSFTACCVAHDDRNPSMSVTEKDGKILVYCFAGCPQEDLLDALGFTVNNNRFTTTRRPSPEKKQYISPTLDYAKQIWAAGNDDDAYVSEQGYCQKKRITHAFGARRGRVNGSRVGRDADCVLVPNRDWEGNLVGIEAINPDGVKQTYGHKGLLMLGHPEEASVVHICEGWATAWAIGHILCASGATS
jgi:hypothetical protein